MHFSITKLGYCSVELFNKGKSKRFLIHRLVAQHFIPNPDNLPQVNHKDENPRNNCVDNLEWCTAKYNMNYGNGAKTRHLKIDYTKPIYRELAIKNSMAMRKPVLQFSRSGEFIKKYASSADASRAMGARSTSHITECCKHNKRYKTAYGYKWEYERSDDLSVYHV